MRSYARTFLCELTASVRSGKKSIFRILFVVVAAAMFVNVPMDVANYDVITAYNWQNAKPDTHAIAAAQCKVCIQLGPAPARIALHDVMSVSGLALVSVITSGSQNKATKTTKRELPWHAKATQQILYNHVEKITKVLS